MITCVHDELMGTVFVLRLWFVTCVAVLLCAGTLALSHTLVLMASQQIPLWFTFFDLPLLGH
jgi:hypothetical protein